MASGVKLTSIGDGGTSCVEPGSSVPLTAWAWSLAQDFSRSEIVDVVISCDSCTPISVFTIRKRFSRPDATSPPPIAFINSDGVDIPTNVRDGRLITFSNFSASDAFIVLVAYPCCRITPSVRPKASIMDVRASALCCIPVAAADLSIRPISSITLT